MTFWTPARICRKSHDVRLRKLSGATAAAILAVAGLAGCRTNVGTAASVDGHRISESRVNDFVTATGPSSAAGSQSASPRSQVLQYLIQEQLFTKTLAFLKKTPSEGALAAAHDPAATLLLQTQLSGRDLDNAVRKGLPSSGIKADFGATFLRVQELEYTIIQAKRLTKLAELLALIKQAKISVSVSPRYGHWNPATLSLDGKAVVPSYLSAQPVPGAAAPTQQPVG
jgi:hypothetical protein